MNAIFNMEEEMRTKTKSFFGNDGSLYLTSCYACDKDNNILFIHTGKCFWCGWSGHDNPEIIRKCF